MNTDNGVFTAPVTGKYKVSEKGIKLMINTDRFLTRVFDTQEKKMIYVGDDIDLKRPGGVLLGVTNDSIIVNWSCSIKEDVHLIKFGDRFVPMLCSGLPGNNKKIIYESDILLNEEGGKIIIVWRDGLFSYLDQKINAYCSVWDYRFKKLEIIGNRWEQPELLEANV